MSGPLDGIRILEFAGIGPGPFCGMMLADQGAEVILIERPVRTRRGAANLDILNRSRKSIVLDLKQPASLEVVRRLARGADGLIEGFRPGVMERLGLGPDVLLAQNPRLVYGRMTGWGQTGPDAHLPGHDINYLALSGVLDALGRAGDKPTPAANLVADFGGGGMMLAFGMLAGILSAKSTGKGQVVDCAMTDGATLLSAMIWTMRSQGRWSGKRGENLLDTGAPCYDTYETSDGRYMAVGSLEPEFYAVFCARMGLSDHPDAQRQLDPAVWPRFKRTLAERFRTKTRDQWVEVFAGADACVTPVLAMDEVMDHPHNAARQPLIEVDGVLQPAPAPRFMGSPPVRPRMPQTRGEDAHAILAAAGFGPAEIAELQKSGALGPMEVVTDAV
ncbi:carnitine dehydratase [Hoeflea sp. BAL378]|uniref:CaiB/BaiF CoA transferase family protein n=1 Tax=Hoeflea sp. BAL378 TaxID=1547437 RepID=UPI000513DFA8|nr:CaiB/BaiF CoA-transferase family protein [Hoeflea sp. BAL378]KGF70714.1 carnitine dehydratase [Hoeflea sp. BAL378]